MQRMNCGKDLEGNGDYWRQRDIYMVFEEKVSVKLTFRRCCHPLLIANSSSALRTSLNFPITPPNSWPVGSGF